MAVDEVLREPCLDRADRVIVEVKGGVRLLVLAVVGGEEALRTRASGQGRGHKARAAWRGGVPCSGRGPPLGPQAP